MHWVGLGKPPDDSTCSACCLNGRGQLHQSVAETAEWCLSAATLEVHFSHDIIQWQCVHLPLKMFELHTKGARLAPAALNVELSVLHTQVD